MASKKLKKKNKSAFDDLKEFCIKYKKYFSAGVLMVLLAVVVAYSSGKTTSQQGQTQVEETASDSQSDGKEEFEVDAYEDINALIEKYYDYYAKGDVDSLKKIAYPISDAEASYIKLFSKYVEDYSSIKCYTKKGISDGEFVASISLMMKFKDVDTPAPGLDFFYIRTDEDGKYYIDNAYSQFNQSNQENTTDSKINSLIEEFEQDEDVIALQKEIQESYNKALEADATLKDMVEGTVQTAITDWVNSFSEESKDTKETHSKDTDTKDSDSKDKDTKETDKEDTDSKTDKEDTDAKDEDTKDSDSKETEVKTKTVYAKTRVNIRKKRSTDSDVLATVDKGTKMTMYGSAKNGWCKVKYKGKTGYVKNSYVTSDKSKLETKETTEKTKTIYTTTKVNIRKKRSTDSDVLYTVKKGTKLTMYGSAKNGWCKVKYKGKTGYVSKDYITTDKSKVKTSSTDSSGTTKKTIYAKTKVNIRKSRSVESDIVKTVKAGTKLTMYGKSKNGWCKVKYKGKTGYVRREYVTTDKSKVESTESSSSISLAEGKRIELSESVNVRSSMSTSSDRVGLAYKGDIVTVIQSYEEGWTKVSWDGKTGYIKSEYLK